METKERAPRNRTLVLSEAERKVLASGLISLRSETGIEYLLGKTIHQDFAEALPHLPSRAVDLLIVDPPYNLDKTFNEKTFRKLPEAEYAKWFAAWFEPLLRLLKPTASIYVCCDWKCSAEVQRILAKHVTIRNRITWEREKGRGAKTNWKNCSEDIWFATMSNDYYFDVDAVKIRRRVIAPYTTQNGRPKDWSKTEEGNFRLTHPSNLWTDISVPFWSMPENTDHPTQKPEKLIAKLILASSQAGDVVFDPFLGSGTTSVVAKKLGRRFFGVEMDEAYCCLAEKRLAIADSDSSIQGYSDGVFWERNTLNQQRAMETTLPSDGDQGTLF
jgi:DNA modification methylase